MTAITELLSIALLHFIWQGVLVGMLLWATLFILRKSSPNARYVASCAALAVMMALPLVTIAVNYESGIPSPALQGNVFQPPPMNSSMGAFPRAIQTPWSTRAQSWTLIIWSIGVLFFSLRIIWGCRHIYALKRQGESAEASLVRMVEQLANRMGIARPIRLLMSSLADGPSVVGWLRPVILLPASSILGLSTEQLEAVVAHELAHIRRHDYLVAAFQVVVETLLFYHPVVWWTSSRIRQERELCCDDLAIRACGDALCYARALTHLERLRIAKPSMVLGAADRGLIYRIQRIMGERTMEYGPSKVSGVLVLSLAFVGLTASMSWFRAEARPQTTEVRAQNVLAQDQGGVSVNLGGSAVIHRAPVEYPKVAIEKKIQGTVSVEATIDTRGNVVDAHVLSGPTELRRAVLMSIFNWHFVPEVAQTTRTVHISFDPTKSEQENKERGTGETQLELRRKLELTAVAERKLEEQRSAEFEGKTYTVRTQPANEAEIKKSLEEAERKLKAARDANVQEPQAEERTKRQIEELRTALSKMDRATGVEQKANTGVVNAIRVIGLSDRLKEQLMSRLPVRVGDAITKELIENIRQAVREFDEHLETRIIRVENGNGVMLQIIAPGGGV